MRFVCYGLASIAVIVFTALAGEMPMVFEENFDHGAERWQPTDAKAWKVEEIDGKHVYNQFQVSEYKPPHRSPLNIALLKDVTVGDFQLDAKVKSTAREYGHRDACIVFDHQDPAHFYYVHVATKADDHANQIFIVNDAPRAKISTKSTAGTKWTEDWHHIRVTRDAESGEIRIYFDDMHTPIMEATDKTFASGRIGIGSFDDTTQWDEVTLHGEKK